jgi:iron complex transport system substrate-binding protein
LDTHPIASTSAAEAMKEFATLQPYAGSAEIIDLGSNSANLKKIMDAKPDVIVTFKGSVDNLYDELKQDCSCHLNRLHRHLGKDDDAVRSDCW